MKRSAAQTTPYITLDGSEIRELCHPDQCGKGHQSLAEARIPPGRSTLLHRHHLSEELYHVSAGSGEMRLGDSRFPITTGDSIRIDPGTPHQLHNNGPETLVVLCCCAPAYAHEDTELLEAGPSDESAGNSPAHQTR
jgi:mannose-6-phosphate isomerase-like protein (cupin superfamily)